MRADAAHQLCPRESVEDDVIIPIEDSHFVEWKTDQLFAHFEQLWSIRIVEAPDLFYNDDFHIPEAMAVLQGIVVDCQLGETFLQPQHHGVRTLYLDDLDLSQQKVACIRQFERRGISLVPPEHIRILEDLRSKGILPSADS
jgi:hypothetical protein